MWEIPLDNFGLLSGLGLLCQRDILFGYNLEVVGLHLMDPSRTGMPFPLLPRSSEVILVTLSPANRPYVFYFSVPHPYSYTGSGEYKLNALQEACTDKSKANIHGLVSVSISMTTTFSWLSDPLANVSTKILLTSSFWSPTPKPSNDSSLLNLQQNSRFLQFTASPNSRDFGAAFARAFVYHAFSCVLQHTSVLQYWSKSRASARILFF